MSKLKVLDLFSGIGGFSLGLERAGMETVAFCEMDKHCQRVLKKHWPDIPIHSDVKKLKGKEFKNIDVICGGFPCQDISVAGQKKGIKDGTRSSLWKEFKRLIKEIKPRYAIIENVANLRNLGLNQVIKDLWAVGYGCEWHIISARSVGACHLRERVWIIAYPYSDSVWEQSGWGRWTYRENKTQLRDVGEIGEAADTDSHGCKPILSLSARNKNESLQFGGTGISSNPNMPRLWQSFASEKEKSEWWAKATAGFRDWWEVESSICRVAHGLPRGLDKARRERIKQLGNSVVPQIPELIGRAILEWEGKL